MTHSRCEITLRNNYRILESSPACVSSLMVKREFARNPTARRALASSLTGSRTSHVTYFNLAYIPEVHIVEMLVANKNKQAKKTGIVAILSLQKEKHSLRKYIDIS